MRKYTIVIGTRPEAIKLLPLYSALSDMGECILVSTSQHGEMLEGVFSDFGIYPDIAFPSAHGSLVSRLMAYSGYLEGVIADCAPDAVIVQGDTLSAYAGAISAYLSGIEVYHVEAGLRTYDIHSPYPEEFIRRSIAAMASLHFAPDETARINLLCEGVPSSEVFVTGNTVVDAISRLAPRVAVVEDKIIFTLHRRESEGAYADIFAAVFRFAAENPTVKILYPVHPRVRSFIPGDFALLPNIIISEPLSPRRFYSELITASLALTDSGGVIEECAALGIPTLVLRDKCERCSEISSGIAKLVGCNGEALYYMLSNGRERVQKKKRRVKIEKSPVERICDILKSS